MIPQFTTTGGGGVGVGGKQRMGDWRWGCLESESTKSKPKWWHPSRFTFADTTAGPDTAMKAPFEETALQNQG